VEYDLKVEKAAGAETVFTDPISATKETPRSDKAYGYLNVSVQGTFVANVELQRRFLDETDWRTVKTYTDEVEESFTDLEYGVEYRLGVPTGGYTSGTANCRLGRA
jgi:hypothetical protein